MKAPASELGGEPTVDYAFDQRGDSVGLSRGMRVCHPSFGEGIVLSCEGRGADQKATVRFATGEKRVLARYLALDS